MTQEKYLIVGQGLAGTCLAYHLEKRGSKVQILASDSAPAASLVIPGIANLLAGKKFNLTWLADPLYQYSVNFYQELAPEAICHKQILRFLLNDKQKEIFAVKKNQPEYEKYISKETVPDYDAFLTENSFWVDVPLFLQESKKKIDSLQKTKQYQLGPDELLISSDNIKWQNQSYDKIIFSDGYHAIYNPLAGFLKFRPARGEILDLKIPNLSDKYIYNFGKFLLPIGNQIFRLGATYTWEDFEDPPTEEAKDRLIMEYKKFFSHDFEILAHKTGTRPIIAGRKPVIGPHPKHKNIYFFNGLASKGVLYAPYFANVLAEHLVNQGDIPEEVDTKRFYEID